MESKTVCLLDFHGQIKQHTFHLHLISNNFPISFFNKDKPFVEYIKSTYLKKRRGIDSIVRRIR